LLGIVALALGAWPSSIPAATSPERAAAVIETVLAWAIEGREIPADPQQPTPALPHRDCGGRLDPEHLPRTVYVSWDLSAEAQHAACNWKYDVASRRAARLSPEETAEAAQQIAAGTLGPQERAFFHSTPQPGGRIGVTAGYCWGSASGTFELRSGKAVVLGELTIHGY
jgi:hypothetical protein